MVRLVTLSRYVDVTSSSSVAGVSRVLGEKTDVSASVLASSDFRRRYAIGRQFATSHTGAGPAGDPRAGRAGTRAGHGERALERRVARVGRGLLDLWPHAFREAGRAHHQRGRHTIEVAGRAVAVDLAGGDHAVY